MSAAGETTSVDALRAAQVWLKFFVDHFDLEPNETEIRVKAIGPDRAEVVDLRTLAQTMAEIDSAIRKAGYEPI